MSAIVRRCNTLDLVMYVDEGRPTTRWHRSSEDPDQREVLSFGPSSGSNGLYCCIEYGQGCTCLAGGDNV